MINNAISNTNQDNRRNEASNDVTMSGNQRVNTGKVKNVPKTIYVANDDSLETNTNYAKRVINEQKNLSNSNDNLIHGDCNLNIRLCKLSVK